MVTREPKGMVMGSRKATRRRISYEDPDLQRSEASSEPEANAFVDVPALKREKIP